MFELKDATNILDIYLIEKPDGALVRLTLADGQSLDDSEEHLVLSCRVEYGAYTALERVKLNALQRARNVIAHEISRLRELENKNI